MKVILLHWHGARVDALGAYGGLLAPTPHCDQLASQGLVFDQHYANTLVLKNTEDPRAGSASSLITDLIGKIHRAGAATVLFGDERVQSYWPELSGWKHHCFVSENDLVSLEQPSLSEGVLQLAVDWLQQFGKNLDQWLLWIDLGALLPPWRREEYRQVDDTSAKTMQPPKDDPVVPVFEFTELDSDEPLPERFGWRLAYSGVVCYLDDLIGQFTGLLSQMELDDQCVIALTSPYGHPLGEQGPVPDRSRSGYEERCHLPFIVRFPGRRGGGKRVPYLTQTNDWWASLAELFEIPGASRLPAQSLIRYAELQGGRLHEYVMTDLLQTDGTIWESSIRTQDWHFLLPQDQLSGRPLQLYRKPEDRWDMNNVINEHPDVADHLELTLWRYYHWSQSNRTGPMPCLRDEILKILA